MLKETAHGLDMKVNVRVSFQSKVLDIVRYVLIMVLGKLAVI
jgi:hypothetical protein